MTLGSHQKTVGTSQTHLTPLCITQALGKFDLDPCACPEPRPYEHADVNWTTHGLSGNWFGRVWCNPPFDRYEVGAWVKKMAAHKSGILLLHTRTETGWFRPIWQHAKAILFLAQRLKFYTQDGIEQKANSGAPVCLIAFTDFDAHALTESGLKGSLVLAWEALD